MPRCLLYYITDRRAFPGNSSSQRESLLAKIGEAARAGVDYIQLREKDLYTHELEDLSARALERVHQRKQIRTGSSSILVNSRADVAIATGAKGVHLPANDLTPPDIRNLWKKRDVGHSSVTISVSCHSVEEVQQAAAHGADLAIFAPVFEKKDAPETKPAGLDALRSACLSKIPVIALGGITLENADACLDAGAAGIAGIRLFQEHNMDEIAERLRG